MYDKHKFYRELMTVLKGLNRQREPQDQISFSQAVYDGLGVAPTFTTKIKAGTYRPTLDRLITLGNFLGVHPATFTDYVERFSDEVLMRENPDYRELGRILASLPQERRNQVIGGLLEQARSKSRAVA